MLLYVVLSVVAVVLLVGLYFMFGPGPVRARAYAWGRKLLDQGDWQQALAVAERHLSGSLPASWSAKFHSLAGDAHQFALDDALKAREFEDARFHAIAAAKHLEGDEAEQVTRVVEAALAEVRRLFAKGDNDPVRRTIQRVDALAGKRVPEATFWDAMCQIRDGDLEGALPKLLQVSEETARQVMDPPFYAGILQFRLGKPQEALKLLSEANRIDSNCPLVTWQIGVALMASGGDSATAMRALQRAMGPRGLPLWGREPHKLWIEGFPEGRSYVRRLATKNGTEGFPDPLLGNDFAVLVKQGNLALAQAYYKQEKFAESADLYGKILESSPPTAFLLRGYGLALARQGRHDEAYKQLRLALEQENPKDPFTAGYLALCGAMGRPTNPADKPKNVHWALRLLATYPVFENAEWAGIVREVNAEARRNQIEVPEADQELACDALASVQADDPKAAATYAHLAMTHPGHVKPIYAWLYTRSATAHGVTSPVDLDLFARTFQDSGKARGFFAQQKWDFDAVEYVYLERAAKRAPGAFPSVLGPDYPPKGEAFLLARSESEEKEGRKENAKASAEVLLRLAPESLKGHDRLACLHYRAGETERAVDLLAAWGRLAPLDHWPAIRQAVIEQERGKSHERREAIGRALDLTTGHVRGAVAFLGAQLALRDTSKLLTTGKARPFLPDLPEEALSSLADGKRLLEECLREVPGHAEALWRLAAVRTITRDKQGLAEQSRLMDRPEEADPRFHYFGAVCHLEAGKPQEAFAIAERAASLQQEARLVMAWAKLRSNETEAAIALLKPVAADNAAPSVHVARALLGQLAFQKGDYDEASLQWAAVDASARARWALDEPLRNTVLLSGLASLDGAKYEQAAERFREAGRLGLRDKRLGGLVTLALVKAGQRLLYGR